MQNFDDIRPYHDAEVSDTVSRVLGDDEFLELIAHYRFPTLARVARGPFKFLLNSIVARGLLSRFGALESVDGMQSLIESYMAQMISRSTDGFSADGLQNLSKDKAYLFLSNHRDITLDPAFTNYALHKSGFSTVRIAIGDNLLTKSWSSDLMRLNKSFIVKRSLTKPRELLKALTKLSAYIKHSLESDNHSVWIAHREGRAKDGIDKSDIAVLKMIFLAKPKSVDFSDYLKGLNIVPISIAYELDPCIALKARELRLRNSGQEYEKAEHEDLESIGLGISGKKGRVHLQFSQPINLALEAGGAFEINEIESLLTYLDDSIVSAYRLFPSNLLAYKKINGEDAYLEAVNKLLGQGLIDQQLLDEVEQNIYQKGFEKHLLMIEDLDQAIALECYANPVVTKLALCGS